MNYGTIKDDYGNIKRCVSFKLIETVTVYNRGQIFYEYTRFSGDESYVIYDDGNIKTSHNENDATVFFSDDEARVAYLKIIDKIKSGEIKYDGIQVIEYDELHHRSSEVLQYPNHHYSDLVQPISIYDGKYSRTWHEAVGRKNRELRHIAYCEFLDYVESRGWKIKNEDWHYIHNLDAYGLRHLLEKNRGRNDLYVPNRRR